MAPVAPALRLVQVTLLAALLAFPTAGHAQTSLGPPAVMFPEDFGSIQTVRELRDGRLLVADALGQALYVVDLAAGTRTVIGQQGQGPQEYQQPDAVWPLPGDSTLLVDLGNGRLTVLGPDMSFGKTSPIATGIPGGNSFMIAMPQGVDHLGRVFARAMGGGFGELPDSAEILRVDRGTRSSEAVASFKLGERTQTTSGGANNRNVQVQNIPLSAEDAWGVAPDGTLVIARSVDYHVERIAPDGTVTRGPAIPFDRVRIGTAEKEEFIAQSASSGGGIGISVSRTNGAATTSFSRGGPGGAARTVDDYTWPEQKAPFYSGRIVIDGQGRAWIRRHVRAGQAATYDVFDASARRMATYTLDGNRRIAGFGERSIYVVSFDEFDLNYLERYALPSM